MSGIASAAAVTCYTASSTLNLASASANLWARTGIANYFNATGPGFGGVGQMIMVLVCLFLIYLAVKKQYEPLLLLPIAFGGLLSNIPVANIATEGFLHTIFGFGIGASGEGIFPILIFIGVGAMTDFGPLIANPKMALLGGAAQFGIFGTLLGAVLLAKAGLAFTMKDCASIAIIGGADGPTSIFLASKLGTPYLGNIAVAAYSYMALVPIIQPPIMKALTTEAERKIRMKQQRSVSQTEKIIFPLVIVVLCAFLLPDAAPLIGALMFGNIIKECGVTERLSKTAQNELCNITTILLGLAVGSKLSAAKFLTIETAGIVVLGLIAFSCGTAAGVLMAKFMNLFTKEKINPLIGSAGVSAVPMAARVSNKVGLEYDSQNFLLMHAMGPNVSGVIGSAVAAGILLALVG